MWKYPRRILQPIRATVRILHILGPYIYRLNPLDHSRISLNHWGSWRHQLSIRSDLSCDTYIAYIDLAYAVLFLDTPSVTTLPYMSKIPDPCNPSNNLGVTLLTMSDPYAFHSIHMYTILTSLLHSVQYHSGTLSPAPPWPMFVSKNLTLYLLPFYFPF